MIELTRRSDVRMVEQAIRNGWDLPERTLADLPARLLEIIVSRDGEGTDAPYRYSTRQRLAAIRCVLTMNGQNIAANPAPQQLDLNVNGQFAFDMEVASTMTREEMAQVSEAMKIVGRNGHNGNGSGHNGNGSG
jgi:hypothetical protein